MATILIDKVPFHYERIDLSYETSKCLDKAIAKENLLLFKEVMDANACSFFLMYGTLLGAVREKDFIRHDIDIDTCSWEEDKLIHTIPLLTEKGLALCRYIPGVIYSFIRKEVYIDVYIVKKASFRWRWKYCVCAGHLFPRLLLSGYENYPFLGTSFSIPAEPVKVLEYLYGKNWQTPVENRPSKGSPCFIVIWRKLTQPARYVLRPLKNYITNHRK